jgi:hypothetical protein
MEIYDNPIPNTEAPMSKVRKYGNFVCALQKYSKIVIKPLLFFTSQYQI